MNHDTTTTDRRRRRLLRWAAPALGVAWLWPLAIAFAVSEPTGGEIALVAAGLATFGIVFLLAADGRALAVTVPALLAIATALTLTADPAFGWLYAWPAAAATVRLDRGRAAAVLVATVALAAAAMAAAGAPSGVLLSATGGVAALGALWLVIGRLMRTSEQLRAARADLAELAVAEERLRFARDLHDLLGHDLSVIALKAELAGRLLQRQPERAAEEIGVVSDLTRAALRQVRDAVDGYRRPTLASELAGARLALDAAGIELRVEGDGAPLHGEVEEVLAWAVREGATNAIRHSAARHAAIVLQACGGTAELEIADDGRGAPGAAPSGHGLTGLRERVQSIGGTVEAGARPGGGFRLKVRAPATPGPSATA
ncbi:MAG: sensor histidine kinase [Solirubrobacterales bacterium]|nr:sensor histidine kinase [Solirubrobacterales bacterium]